MDLLSYGKSYVLLKIPCAALSQIEIIISDKCDMHVTT